MTNRERLEAAARYLLPRARHDAKLTDRELALMVLSELRIDVGSTRSGNDQMIADRADAFVVEYAIGVAARTAEERRWHAENDKRIAATRDATQKRRDIAAKLSREPLPNSTRRGR